MPGFFSLSTVHSQAKKPVGLVPKCGACQRYKDCQNPKAPYTGEGKKGILIVFGTPSRKADSLKKHRTQEENAKLKQALLDNGVSLFKDCWQTSAVACGTGKPADGTHANWCSPLLMSTIKKLQPEVIILLGDLPCKALMPMIWKPQNEGLATWLGWTIPSQVVKAWVCPTYDPENLPQLGRGAAQKDHPVSVLQFGRHIAAALSKSTDKFPLMDFKRQVKVTKDVKWAAMMIRKTITGHHLPVAVDYETDRLKPDGEGEIVCCSVSNGLDTYAYPWHGEAIEATKELLLSGKRIIASNMKFEDRWTRAKLGIKVKNWFMDTMLAAHVLDHRPGITSLKFQAFVLLGQPEYNAHIEDFLQPRGGKTAGGYAKNTIKECDLDDLMLYCGLDSLLEWKVARIQKNRLLKGIQDAELRNDKRRPVLPGHVVWGGSSYPGG